MAVKRNPAIVDEPTVEVTLPLPPESESGLNRDMNEYVTVNGVQWVVPRGKTTTIPVSVFIQLRNKFPSI